MNIVDESRYGYVYVITNKINNKKYVGQHRIIKGELWSSYMGSGVAISKAIKKYGVCNFRKELLLYADSPGELNFLEIKEIKRLDKCCVLYNISKREFINSNYIRETNKDYDEFWKARHNEGVLRYKEENRKFFDEHLSNIFRLEKSIMLKERLESEPIYSLVEEIANRNSCSLVMARKCLDLILENDNIVRKTVRGPMPSSTRDKISKKITHNMGVCKFKKCENHICSNFMSKKRSKYCSSLCRGESQSIVPIGKIIELYMSGVSKTEIAKRVGVSQPAISKRINKYMKEF